MRLIERLAARKAAFYFVERDGVAYTGTLELEAVIARWLTPGWTTDVLPELLPFWKGSYLPFADAFRRWGFPDVGVMLVGCREASFCRMLCCASARSAGRSTGRRGWT